MVFVFAAPVHGESSGLLASGQSPASAHVPYSAIAERQARSDDANNTQALASEQGLQSLSSTDDPVQKASPLATVLDEQERQPLASDSPVSGQKQ